MGEGAKATRSDAATIRGKLALIYGPIGLTGGDLAQRTKGSSQAFIGPNRPQRPPVTQVQILVPEIGTDASLFSWG